MVSLTSHLALCYFCPDPTISVLTLVLFRSGDWYQCWECLSHTIGRYDWGGHWIWGFNRLFTTNLSFSWTFSPPRSSTLWIKASATHLLALTSTQMNINGRTNNHTNEKKFLFFFSINRRTGVMVFQSLTRKSSPYTVKVDILHQFCVMHKGGTHTTML